MNTFPPLGTRGGVWHSSGNATEEALRELRTAVSIDLPESYFEFLRLTNGGEGDLGIEPGWFVLWSAEEVLNHNVGYRVQEFLPGLFAFGSNGGGELIAFDLRDGSKGHILMVPFIPMEVSEAILVAGSFGDFVKQVGVLMDAGTV